MNEANLSGERRIFGLDLMRMLAICFVLHSHTAKYVSSPAGTQTALHFFGMVGVELFFVLSGFLIGSILIRIVESPNGLTPRSTVMFWIRRWVRTLPNYYLAFFLFVGVIIWITKVNILHFPDYQRMLYFMENMTGPPPVLYTIAWSLAVEEWFYLCFPLLILPFLLLPAKWRRNAVLFASLLVVLFSLGLRAYAGWGPHGDWSSVFRKLVPMRMDAIAMGVLAAWTAGRFPANWRKWKWLALSIGAGMLAVLYADYFGHDMYRGKAATYFACTSFLTLQSLGMALLLPFFSALRFERSNALTRFVGFFAGISYSLYLYHVTVMTVLSHYPGKELQGWGAWAVAWTASIAVSAAVYYLFERPITRLRERIGRREDRVGVEI